MIRAVVVGSGPSLDAEQCEQVREWATVHGWRDVGDGGQRIVIAVNASFLAVRFAHHVYACDNAFWDAYIAEVKHECPRATLWSVNTGPGAKYGVKLMVHDGGRDWGSGMQAVRLAEQLGAVDVALLGFDWGIDQYNRRHWHEDHPYPCNNNVDFEGVARSEFKMPVTNCTPTTKLDWFPKMELQEWLTRPLRSDPAS